MAGTTQGGYPIAPTEKERAWQLRLHRIAVHGTGKDVRNAILDGADANFADANGKTPLHVGAAAGRLEIVRELLPHCDLSLRDTSGRTALIDAVRPAAFGHPDAMRVVHALIEAGADINAADTDGFTALMAASYHAQGTHDFCEALIGCGADAQAFDASGWSALHWACQKPDKRQSAVVRTLVQAGCWVNQPAIMGANTPLHLAVTHACPEVVIGALLACGADPLALNGSGRTPAGLAADRAKKEAGYAAVAKRLKEAAARKRAQPAQVNGPNQGG